MIIRLDQQIDCGTLCKQIAKMVDRYKKENSLDNKVISVKIVEMNEGNEKLSIEYKENNNET